MDLCLADSLSESAVDLSSAAAASRLQSSSCSSSQSSSQESSDSNPCSSGYNSDGQDVKRLSKCDLCDYTTNRRSNLARHLCTMHEPNIDQKALECCEVKFSSKSHLKNHKRLFHADGYPCRICSRLFCRRALLRRHMNVHSGRKDYSCDRCVYATSHKSNLERHCQRLHGINFAMKTETSKQQRRKRTPKTSSKEETDKKSMEFASRCDWDTEEQKVFQKPRLFTQLYRCKFCESNFHSQVEQGKHSEICEIAHRTSTDESVIMAALALTQLRYGSN